MATVKPKAFTYAVVVDRAGRLTLEEEETFVALGDEWTADHLLLAAVVRCSIASLCFHARRADVDCAASGTARGVVTKPDGEDRYRFVRIEARLDAELDPPPAGAELDELLARAERDCFVGSSLRTKPVYAWRVNGRDV